MVYNMDTSVLLFVSSNTLLIAATCAIIMAIVYLTDLAGNEKKMNRLRLTCWPIRMLTADNNTNEKDTRSMERLAPPGPKPLPIIGNLACMGGYEVPYQAFNDLAKQYGPIVGLRLGSVPTVVVNGIENIKEVLITKSSHFDARPNFRRYHELFGGDKQNCKYIRYIYSYTYIFS